MADRGLLHENKIEDFSEFLVGLGYKIHPCKGPYEVLRVRQYSSFTIFHQRTNSSHVTSSGFDGGTRLVNKFMRNKNQLPKERGL